MSEIPHQPPIEEAPAGTAIGIALRARVRGDVLTDGRSLLRYSTDQSIYQIAPLAVVIPAGVDDIVATVQLAAAEGIPVTPRGGGSGTAGAALGRGIVLAFPWRGPMNHIVGYDEPAGKPQVTVEPGVLHDDMQRYLRERGYFMPADPSSGSICVLGGNVATKASGPHALKHGSIDRYLVSLQYVAADGTLVDTARPATIPPHIVAGVADLRRRILADEATASRLRARMRMKLASGYNLFTFLRDAAPADLVAQLFVGSVGTLGVITQATVRAEPYLEGRASMLIYFRSLHEAGDAAQHISAMGVAAVEIMNARTISVVKERQSDLEVPEGDVHMLMVEFEGPARYEEIAAVERLLLRKGYDMAGPPLTAEDEKEQEYLWKVRKSLFPVLRNYRPGLQALSLVNDVGVSEEHLADLIVELEAIFARHGLVAAIYGHAGSGNLHLRPLFDVADPQLPSLLEQVADDVYTAVLARGGTITAEHGMGRLRTRYLEQEWGPTIVGYMREVKALFDPGDKMNPEVMFSNRRLIDDLKPLSRQSAESS